MTELEQLLEAMACETSQLLSACSLLEAQHKDLLRRPTYWQLKTNVQAAENMLYSLINQVSVHHEVPKGA